MAIEDHPKFDQWAQALDSLKEAKDSYRAATNYKRSNLLKEHAAGLLAIAQKHYNQLSDEIGNA